MKASVDSLELSRAIALASKMTSKTTLGITDTILITAKDDAVFLRSTTFLSNALIRVNAWEVEEGEAVVSAKNLSAIVFDSGRVTIRSSKANLLLDYEDTGVKTRLVDATSGDFPIWQEPETTLEVRTDLLRVACEHTEKEDVSGRGPVVACVHIASYLDSTIVFAAEMAVGYMSVLDKDFGIKHLAIDGNLLRTILSAMGDHLVLGMTDNTVSVSTVEGHIKYSFSRSTVPESFLGIIDQAFFSSVRGKVRIPFSVIGEMMKRCRAAVSVDEAAQVKLATEKNEMLMSIRGDGIELDFFTPVDGHVPPGYFYAKYLVKSLSTMRQCDEVVFSASMHDDQFRFMEFVGPNDKHLVFGIIPTAFQN